MDNASYECVLLELYNLLINGKRVDSFRPTRGLHQEDPISLYLFLLVCDTLFVMITNENELRNLKGIKLRRNGPKLSHLFFLIYQIILRMW